jgi:hypothetical protein
VENRCLALASKRRRLAWTTLVLVLGAACSPVLKKRPGSDEATAEVERPRLRFRSQALAAKHEAAKASPQSFEPVFTYTRAIADLCLASLVDKRCASCEGGPVRYKRLSELDPHNWPFIEDALSMIEVLTNVPGLDATQMDQAVALKGRLLWLGGHSTDEETLIDGYALTHPDAVAVVRRRLELLRDDGDVTELQSQCARSRARMTSAPEAAHIDLLAACVELNPDNRDARADSLDYAQYLPNLSPAEDQLYRTYLVRRCLEMVGDEESRCAESCACNDKPGGRHPTAKCKRGCRDCRSETDQKVRVCKQLGEAPPAPRPKAAPARTHRRKAAPASAPRPKGAPVRRPKPVAPGAEPQQAVL